MKAAIDADAESYNAVMKAYKQAKDSGDADGIIDAALKQATSVPLGVAERAREVVGIVERAAAHYESQYEVGPDHGYCSGPGGHQALANVEINLESLKDSGFTADTRKKVAALTSLTAGAMHLSGHGNCPFVSPFCRKMGIQYGHKSHLNAHISSR